MYNKLQAFEAINARIAGIFDNPELMKLGALLPDQHADVLRIIAATNKDEPDWLDNAQIQLLLDNNEKYDVLLFVQIPETYFTRELYRAMVDWNSFMGNTRSSTTGEFMVRVAHLENIIAKLKRYKDKTSLEQAEKLYKDLKDVQYIHVIK